MFSLPPVPRTFLQRPSLFLQRPSRAVAMSVQIKAQRMGSRASMGRSGALDPTRVDDCFSFPIAIAMLFALALSLCTVSPSNSRLFF